MRTLTLRHPFLFLFVSFLLIGLCLTFPQSRGVKEESVGEKRQVDPSDGEIWYPVEGEDTAASKAEPLPVPQAHQNVLASDLVEAVRNIFVKWGYSVDEIPQPFGNGDPSIPFRSTPEFIRVLELLVEKLPTELDLPILHILKDNGVEELNIPKGTYENSVDLQKIDEIIAQIEKITGKISSSPSNSNAGHETKTAEEEQVDGKNDPVKGSTTLCEKPGEACSEDAKTGKWAMHHPKIPIPKGELLIDAPQFRKTPKQDASTLIKDKQKLETLIQEVKHTVEDIEAEGKPPPPEVESKMAQNLNQITQLVEEVESIAEKNTKTLVENPCTNAGQASGHDHGAVQEDLKKLDSMIQKMEHDQAALEAGMKGGANEDKKEKVHQDLAEIEKMIKEMEASEVKLISSGPESPGNPSLQGVLNELDQIIADMQKQESSKENQRHPSTSGDQNHQVEHQLEAIDTIMREIQAFQSQGQESSPEQHVKGQAHDDVSVIDQMIQDIRKYQAEFHPEFQISAAQQGGHDGDLKAIDSLIADIRNFEAARAMADLENTAARPKHHDDTAKVIDSMIQKMKADEVGQMVSDMERQQADYDRKSEHRDKMNQMGSIMNRIQEHQARIPLQLDHVGDRGNDAQLKEIDYMIDQLKNLQPSAGNFEQPRGHPDMSEFESTMNQIRQLQANPQTNQNRPTSHGGGHPDMSEFESTMNQIRQLQANPQTNRNPPSSHGSHPDMSEFESTMNQIRQLQANPQTNQNLPIRHGGQPDMSEFESTMNQIRQLQTNPQTNQNRPSGHPDMSELEATMNQVHQLQAKSQTQEHHVPKHGSRDAEIQKLDNLINDIKTIANNELSEQHAASNANQNQVHELDNMIANMRDKYGAASGPNQVQDVDQHHSNADQLQMLDKIVKEIGKLAEQEEKHIEDEEKTDKAGEIEDIMKEIQQQQDNAASKAAVSSQNTGNTDQHMSQIHRIMADLERESDLERDLQQALDAVEHTVTKEDHKATIAKTNQIMSDIGDIQRKQEHNAVIAKTNQIMSDIGDIQRKHDQKATIAKTNQIMSDMSDFQTKEEAKEINRLMQEIQQHQNSKAEMKDTADQIHQITNKMKVQEIQDALRGNPKHPSGSEHHRIPEEDQGIAEINSHLKKAGDAAIMSEIDKVMKEIGELQQNKRGQGHGVAEGIRKGGETFQEDQFNAADQGYIRRLRQMKLKKQRRD